MNRPTGSDAWRAAVEFSPYLLLFLLIVTSYRPWSTMFTVVAAWLYGRWRDRR